jgi:hypothetical protein
MALTACIYEGFWLVEYSPINALSLRVCKRARSRDRHNTYVLRLKLERKQMADRDTGRQKFDFGGLRLREQIGTADGFHVALEITSLNQRTGEIRGKVIDGGEAGFDAGRVFTFEPIPTSEDRNPKEKVWRETDLHSVLTVLPDGNRRWSNGTWSSGL